MKQFGFTFDTDINDIEKISSATLIFDLLNEKLSIQNYSQTVSKIVFVYLAVNIKNFTPRQDFIKFRRKNNVIEIGLNIDYDNFIKADFETALSMMALLYLKGIEKLISKRKDFDSGKFHEDVEKLFEQILNKQLHVA